ncbi:acetyl-CoA synthetase-like protein [Artomyces pyxidatus]|uniref:Acetyl-CoA synthetase-like protein n=1 Tax=Artomyces pyxidatus TaxID=48021 RepID=A0ACB8TIY9_9AGAM|nr:acetyl-CoA synthetase-like protein [Artomyces pyxidatus]
MSSLRSHLTVLDTSASLYASSPAFQLPRCDLQSGEVQHWEPVTYAQFQRDVEMFARHWARVLKADGIPQRSVIGMWLGGMTYTDVLHIYGLSRAGYIPQLFSVRLPNPTVVFELLSKANAKGLVFDPSFESIIQGCPVPSHCSPDFSEIDPRDEPLPVLPAVTGSDTAFVFHTSGSTSNSPKLVPCSYSWVDATVMKTRQIGTPKVDGRRDVTVWMGSMCHIGQTCMLMGSLQHGACTIQPSKIAFSADELSWMVQKCGLNRLNQFASFLANHLRSARKNPKLLSLFQSLDEVLYSGLPLPREEEVWAYENAIKLRNLFGSTECGPMLLSIGGSESTAALMRTIEGTSYGLLPQTPSQPSVPSESGHQTTTSQMLELVILSDSGDCPDSSLRASDGHFHTGDLFVEARPGCYAFKGRDDDWIKSENSLRCDTKAIEDNVQATCADLVSECIVVGNGRPSPVLFIEQATDMPHNKLKREILRRTRQFHSRRYLHERITSADMIVIVEKGTLPRTATKGNIRRKATEETYKDLLDKIYGLV